MCKPGTIIIVVVVYFSLTITTHTNPHYRFARARRQWSERRNRLVDRLKDFADRVHASESESDSSDSDSGSGSSSGSEGEGGDGGGSRWRRR